MTGLVQCKSLVTGDTSKTLFVNIYQNDCYLKLLKLGLRSNNQLHFNCSINK